MAGSSGRQILLFYIPKIATVDGDEQKDESNPQGFCCDKVHDAIRRVADLRRRGVREMNFTGNGIWISVGWCFAFAFGYEKNRDVSK